MWQLERLMEDTHEPPAFNALAMTLERARFDEVRWAFAGKLVGAVLVTVLPVASAGVACGLFNGNCALSLVCRGARLRVTD